MKKQLIYIWLLCIGINGFAQNYNLSRINSKEANYIAGLDFFTHSLSRNDSIITRSFYRERPMLKNWFSRKLLNEHFLTIREKDFELNISPLLIVDYRKLSTQDDVIFRNTRGIYLQANISNKISFYSTFYENQSGFMEHVSDFSQFYGVVPGQGYHKPFKDTLFDYAWSEGMINLKINEKINLQFGHGKNFVGKGYRSMLFSDNSFSYPQLYGEFKNEKIRYATWFTSFMNPDLPEPVIILNNPWHKKAGVFHYLQYKPANFLQISLFEGSILSSRNELGKYEFSASHFNPLILVNGISGKGNTVIGTGIDLQNDNMGLYSQFLISDNDFAKSGGQLGLYFNHHNQSSLLTLQTEVNIASKGLYTSGDSTVSYTHYNQPIAHPLGDNFTEFVFKMIYRYRSVELSYKYNFATTRNDTLGYLPGLNLFQPEDNLMAFDKNAKRQINEVKLSYIINPQYNLRLTIGLFTRSFKYKTERATDYFYFSLQTDLFNRYYDF